MQGTAAPSPVAGLVSVLEADFRQLSHDARKSEGFASFFNNSDNQPEVKEAAERAVMKIRAVAEHHNALDQIRSSKASTHSFFFIFTLELLKPLQLSCDTKSARLISQSLATVQKMVSNEALSPEGADSVIEMLAKVEKMGDEGVQLKVLQTALTLLQSPLHPTTEDGIATILGLCFRSLTQKGRKDTVTSTAAATVRQSVAIVFTYVDVGAELGRLQRLQLAAEDTNAVAAAAAAKAAADAFPSLAPPPSADDLPSQELSAAQKLLEDLIAIATGAPPTWLKTPSLPRTFILEVLDFALANSSELFMSLPDFQSALSLRISQLLQAQLQDYLDAGAAGAQLAAANFPAFKATLRCVRTLLVRYHTQLGIRCGTLIQTVLRGLGSGQPATQRIAIGQLVKQILEDAPLMYYLFITFDMQRDRKLDAVRALVGAVADTVDSALKNQGASENGAGGTSGGGGGTGSSGNSIEEINADAIGVLFQSRSQNKDWSVDTDYETATPAAQHAYLAMLSLDSLLHFMASVEVLTYAATEGGGELQGSDWYALSTRERLLLGTPREVASSAPPPLPIEHNACAALVNNTWRATLSVLSQMLALSTRESMVLSLLKGYQGFTQACGVLELEEPRDAFLGALCQLALAADGERPSLSGSGVGGGGGRASGSYSRSSSPRLERAGSGGNGSYSPRSPSSSAAGGAAGGGGFVGSPTNRHHHRTTSVEDVDGGIVLTPKNVQAMRTLFNIAHRLANVLGPGWALVLETLNTLDRVLHSPKTTTQDGGGGGGVSTSGGGINTLGAGPLLSSDLAILSAAASQLFECTRDMSREAVVALLSGLRDVSIAHMPHAAQVSQPRMFALERMVEVLLFNIHRIYDLWGIFLSHVLEIVDDPKPLVRAAAIDALGQAIVGALGGLSGGGGGDFSTATNTANSTSAAINSSANTNNATVESTGGLEHMLLVALEALHNDERERDVRVGVLRVLLAVLQRHGERLTDGWTPVFRLLAVVPGQEDPETVSLGFQSLQLAATDYMPAMSFSRLKRCLEVAVAYGEQQTDLNVSLTTISLLWNVGDMLSRTRLSGERSGGGGGAAGGGAFSRKDGGSSQHRRSVSTASATSVGHDDKEHSEIDNNNNNENKDKSSSPTGSSSGGGGGSSGLNRPNQLVAVTTPAQVEELLELIFSALQSLSQDPRPEVRNSGARTLFAVVITQGPRLSRIVWERCLWELLFPLLRHAFHMSATSSKEEAEAALLGRSKGAQVRLVMHHSRNTEQKQWDETVVVAVGGMARLLRAHLPAIAAMEGMEAGWDELMIVAESSLAGGRKEVAVAAVGLLGGVLGAHGGDDTVVTPSMWRRSMRALDVGVEAATSAGCLVPLTARTELVQLVGALYTQLRPRFSESDTISVFRWVEAFCRNPWSEDDATNVVQTVGMPPVQKAALALLPTIGPDHLPELWPRYVFSIVKLVQPVHVVAAWQEHHEAELAAAASATAAAEIEQGHSVGGGHDEIRRVDSNTGPVTPARPSGGPSSLSTGLGATPGPLGTGGIASSVQLGASKRSQHKFALNSAFLEKVIALLVQVYDAAPIWVRAVTFAKVVEALGHCMELRFTVYQEKLWRSAATTFNQLVPIGVSAVGMQLPTTFAADPDCVNAVTQSWSDLATVYENFLLGEKFLREQMGVEAPKLPIAAIHRRGPSTSSEQHGTNISSELPVVPVLDVPKKGAAVSAATKKDQTSATSALRRGFGKKASSTATAKLEDNDSTGGSTSATNVPPAPLVDAAQGRADVDLELSVLDSLTDDVLTKCGPAPLALKRRLIAVVDRGIARPRELSIPQATTGSNFSHVCVRKMYVLCSRVGGENDGDDSLLLVARLALPLFLSRCDTMLRNFAEEARPGFLGDGPPVTRPRLDEIMCVLEVVASMAVAPSVVDAVLATNEPISAVINALRARPEVAARGRERTHLLLLYNSLCACVTCKEPRVREMVRDVLGLAGAELGLGM